MDYLISFLEGIITFVSPCLLPLLPLYLSYFAGQDNEGRKKAPVINALGFVLGFSLIFVLMGAFAGTIGGWIKEYGTVLNLISGAVVILFGLNYTGLLRMPFLNNTHQMKMNAINPGFLSSISFGLIFAIGWTPCVGAFLGSALMLAASSGESLKGILMLLSFSLGLGIPFLASAMLIDRLKSTFTWIKRNYRVVNLVSGIFLVIIGSLMATGLMGYFLSLLTF